MRHHLLALALLGGWLGPTPAADADEPRPSVASLVSFTPERPYHRLYELPGDAAAAASPSFRTAKLGRVTLVLADVDGNGRYDDVGLDGWTWKERGYRYLAPVEHGIVVRGERVFFEMHENGRSLLYRKEPLEGRRKVLETLALMNHQRMLNGLAPANHDPDLSEGCRLHCVYCANHGQTHEEVPGEYGYTEAGAKAGRSSSIGSGTGVLGLARDQYRQFFHRMNLIHPFTRSFGIAEVEGFSCIDGMSAREARPWSWPVVVPAPDSEGHPISFATNERPRPYPPGIDPGFPLTLSWPWGTEIEKVEATLRPLTRNGKPLPLHVTWPGKAASPRFTHNFHSICVIPEGQLKPRTRYEATVRASVANEPYQLTWEFRTGLR